MTCTAMLGDAIAGVGCRMLLPYYRDRHQHGRQSDTAKSAFANNIQWAAAPEMHFPRTKTLCCTRNLKAQEDDALMKAGQLRTQRGQLTPIES